MIEPEDQATDDENAALDREWEARLQRLATEATTAATPPRRFTICDDNPRTNDEIVFAWGIAFDDQAVIYRRSLHDKSSYARVTDSPERTLRLYSRITDVRLIWLDPEPEAGPSAP